MKLLKVLKNAVDAIYIINDVSLKALNRIRNAECNYWRFNRIERGNELGHQMLFNILTTAATFFYR